MIEISLYSKHNIQEGFSGEYEPLDYSCQNQQECLRKLVKLNRK